MEQQQQERQKIGAIWERISKNDKEYLSGEFEIDGVKTSFIAFRNLKKSDKHPDFNIYLSEPRK